MSPERVRDPDTGKLPIQSKQPVLILGAGISGLSVADRLLDTGKYDVTHWSDRPVEEMTSSKAAAFWYPICVKGDQNTIADWSAETLAHLTDLTATPEAGVRMKHVAELHRVQKDSDPPWANAVPDFRHAPRSELPPEFVDAYLLTVPVVHMRYYLAWLMQKNASRGATIETKKAESSQQALDAYDVVVNCTGMGSRELGGVQDAAMVPVRGQLVRIKNPGDIQDILLDEDNKDVTYLCPRTAPDHAQSDVVLGGTFEEGNESMEIDMATAQAIIERCAQFHESIRTAQILGHVVGHRPMRTSGIRLEEDSAAPTGKRLFHNYGHGGSGVTVAQGCARDVVKLIEK